MTISKETPIKEALSKLAKEAAKKKHAKVRNLTRIKVGEIGHQGDIYIHRVADGFAKGPEIKNRQLATGTTMGSRHMAVGKKLRVYAPVEAPPSARNGALLGPVVVADAPWTIEHPEHPHHSYPAGTFAVVHQMDALTGQAVQD